MHVLSSRILLQPSDFAQSRIFYEERLGLGVYREYGDGDHIVGVVFFLGGGFLEITSRAGPRPSGYTRLWLQVPDVMAEQSRLRTAGVDIAHEATPMPWGLIEMTVLDPDGFEVIIVEVPEGHRLRTG